MTTRARTRSLAAAAVAIAIGGIASPPRAASAPPRPSPSSPTWTHELRLEIDPAAGRLRVTDRITPAAAPAGRRTIFLFSLGSAFDVSALRINGSDRRAALVPAGESPRSGRRLFTGPEIASTDRIEMIWEGIPGTEGDPAITSESATLDPRDGWIPAFGDEPARHHLSLVPPAGWTVLTQGRCDPSDQGALVCHADQPSDGLALVAGRFHTATRARGGLELRVHLLDDRPRQAEVILDLAASLLDRLEPRLGPCPWPKLDLVQSPRSPAAGSRPSLILLEPDEEEIARSADLARLLAAQWWGGLVLPSDPADDWTGGMAALSALPDDPDEAARDRAGWSIRMQAGGEPGAGAARHALVFQQLRRVIPADAFDRGARSLMAAARGRRAGWGEVRSAFEAASSSDLGWFFGQWSSRADLPAPSLEDVQAQRDGPQVRVTGRVTQPSPPWKLAIPLGFTTPDPAGRAASLPVVMAEGEATRFSFTLDRMPFEARLDPGGEVPRRPGLHGPAALAVTLRSDRLVHVVPADLFGAEDHPYIRLARMAVSQHGGTVVSDTELRETDLEGRSLFVLGAPWENRIAALLSRDLAPVLRAAAGSIRVPGGSCEGTACAVLISGRNPRDPSRTVSLYFGLSPAALERSQHLLSDRFDTWVLFRSGVAAARGTEPADEGIPLAIPTPLAARGAEAAAPEAAAAPREIQEIRQAFTYETRRQGPAPAAEVRIVRQGETSTFAAQMYPVPASNVPLEPDEGVILVEPEDLASLGAWPAPAAIPRFEGAFILTVERPAADGSAALLAEMIQGAARLRARALVLMRVDEGRSVYQSILSGAQDPLATIPFAGPPPDLLVLGTGPDLGADLLGRQAFGRLAAPPETAQAAGRFSPWLLDLQAGASAPPARSEGQGANLIRRIAGSHAAATSRPVVFLEPRSGDDASPGWLDAVTKALSDPTVPAGRDIVLASLDPAREGRPAAAALAAWLDEAGLEPAGVVAVNTAAAGPDAALEVPLADEGLERLAGLAAGAAGAHFFHTWPRRPGMDGADQAIPASLAPWARRGIPVMQIVSTGDSGKRDPTFEEAAGRAIAALAAAMAEP